MTLPRATPVKRPTPPKPAIAPPSDIMSSMQSKPLRIPRILDWIWVIGLMVYVYAGMPNATFHPDESQFVYTSNDYWVALVDGHPERLEINANTDVENRPETLLGTPPYTIDSDAELRLLNGSVNRYAIGFLWEQSGQSRNRLPQAPGWDWGRTYDENMAKMRPPVGDLLNLARTPSTVFLMLSIPIVWALGYKGGGRVGAYLATFLYALNPAILLNGRRTMQEGSMLFFGLFTIYMASYITSIRARKRSPGSMNWLIFCASAVLALASKHTGVIFVAAAFGWLVAADLTRLTTRVFFGLSGWVFAVPALLVLIIGGFIALSPGLWSNPITRALDLVQLRSDLLNLQSELFPTTVLQTPDDRINAIFSQPFTTPLMHFEAPSWGEVPAVQDEIAAYENSGLNGIAWGEAGIFPTLLALIGFLLALFRLREQDIQGRAFSMGMIVWSLVTVLALTYNPLNWQRYYLPLIPVAGLLAGCAIGYLLKPREQKDFLTTSAAIQQYS
ncbi:MAG: glycosyltransferase family 39 protein [Anaerolineae bacterium]